MEGAMPFALSLGFGLGVAVAAWVPLLARLIVPVSWSAAANCWVAADLLARPFVFDCCSAAAGAASGELAGT